MKSYRVVYGPAGNERRNVYPSKKGERVIHDPIRARAILERILARCEHLYPDVTFIGVVEEDPT